MPLNAAVMIVPGSYPRRASETSSPGRAGNTCARRGRSRYAQLCFRAVGAGGAPEYPSPRGPARRTSRTLPTHTSFSRRRSLRIASGWGARRQSSARQKGAGGGRKKGGPKNVVVARALTEPVAASRDVHVALADGLQARVARVLEVRHGPRRYARARVSDARRRPREF